MSILQRLFGHKAPDPRAAVQPLYAQIVANARQPLWYTDGGVLDSVDGRFDMVATILSLVMLRLERQREHAGANALLTEIFVDDMDAQMREFGMGDIGVGKHVGKLMGSLGGRLGALRDAMGAGGDLEGFIHRNLYRGEDRSPALTQYAATELRSIATRLSMSDGDRIVAGTADW